MIELERQGVLNYSSFQQACISTHSLHGLADSCGGIH